ncbi:MAG: hypothetical protein ACLSCU_09225 [Eubacterium sp.]
METIVRFVKLKEEAHIPVYGSDQAAGADLYACLEEPVEVKQGQTVFIPTGLSMESLWDWPDLYMPAVGWPARKVWRRLTR